MTGDQDRRLHADALRRQIRIGQVRRFKRQALIMLSSIALGGLVVPSMLLDPETMRATGYLVRAKAASWMASGTDPGPGMLIVYKGQRYYPSVHTVAADPYFQRAAGMTVLMIKRGCVWGFLAWLAGLFTFRKAMARRRARALSDRVIAGTLVTSEKRLARLVRRGAGAPALRIGTVPLPAQLETRHLAMIGTTGSGKTTVLRQMLDGIEVRGEAALVYDTSGAFVAHYYRPERGDIILNPFDARCAFWTPFGEMAHPADADRIATQLITETGEHDRDIWLETSRILVANMIRALWREGKGTLPDLLDALQTRTKEDLKAWLGNTSSARTFADDADRATGSVLFMLAKASNLIQFLRASGAAEASFAFRDFIGGLDASAGAKPWIFVPRKEDFFEASKPLLACWLECAASAVLGLGPSADRRIWFILDELADLPRVDNLARLLPEGRKFGAAVVLTFQALGQMRHRYGPQLAEAILGCCNSKLFLQTIDSETRSWASKTIGECEVEIPMMTDALAEGDGRPRTTLSKIRKIRPAVLESELRLPKYEGYLLLPDALPVARIALTDAHVRLRGPARQPAFMAGDPKSSLWEQGAPATKAPARAKGRSKRSSAPPKTPGPV